MKISKREKMLLITALLFIPLLLLSKFLLLPHIEQYSAMQSTIVEKSHQLEIDKLIIRDSEKYERLLQESSWQLTEYISCFYQDGVEKVRVELIKQLDELARSSDLKIKNKQLELFYLEGDNLSRIKYMAELEGNLSALVNYLQGLNAFDRYIQVEELEVKGGENHSELSILVGIEVITIEGDIHENI